MKLTYLLQISTQNLMNGKSDEKEEAKEREGGISIIEPSGPKKKKSKVKKKMIKVVTKIKRN
jgi:hypothetical protein